MRSCGSTVPNGFYVHVPFCSGKCDYCAFYSIPCTEALADRYLAGLARECAQLKSAFPGFRAETIYIGGGTPTELSERQLEALCALAAGMSCSGSPREWTVEANPESATRSKLNVLWTAGVRRISIGAQSFDDVVLRRLGRRHTAADTLRAVSAARSAGFSNIGLDLIACVPGVDAGQWKACLAAAVELQPAHLSVYALTVEEGTKLLEKTERGAVLPLDDDAQVDALDAAESLLTDAGYMRYEISNYCRPGFECVHNTACWRGGDYLGAGPAAASHIGGSRWSNRLDLESHLSAVERNERPPRFEETLSPVVRASELLMLGLRTSSGVDTGAVAEACGIASSAQKKWIEVLMRMSESGLVQLEGRSWVLTRRGRHLADHVARELM